MSKPRFAKRRLSDGSYLVWSDDQRTLFRIYGYDEDGSLSKQRTDGTWRTVTGRCWAIEMLLSDYGIDEPLDDVWRVVQRRDGLITGVDHTDVLRYGQWETLNGQETLAGAWAYALASANDGWLALAKLIEDARRRRGMQEPFQ